MDAGARTTRSRVLVFIPVLLALSGALALVYETLWMRRFTTLFGAGAPAAAATLSALFAGLALGSAWFGPRAPRWRRPLRAYAWLELGAVLGAALVEPLLAGYADLAPRLAGEGAAVALVKTGLAFAALLVPTFLLGGTLPAALAALGDERPEGAGRLYAANTLGAVLGVLGATFVLLPTFGAQGAYRLALLAGAVLGLLALALEARAPLVRVASEAPPELPTSRAARAPLHGLAFASGLVLLAAEVAWMRLLAQVHSSSLSAFALVLALFLAALAGGAWLASELRRRALPHAALLNRAWLVAGLATLAGPLVFQRLTDGLAKLAPSAGGHAPTAALPWLASACLVPATLAGGMVLPLLLLGLRGAAVAPGSVLAANTLGAVVGPLLAGFALFPTLGLWGTFLALGVVQLLLARPWRTLRPSAVLVVVALACAASVTLARLPRVHLDARRGERLVWLEEGSHGIVAAIESGDELRLKLDNAYTLGGTGSAGDARMLAHVPLLVHPAARRVAFLGLGTGLTASAMLRHPFEEAVIYELVPEVAHGVRAAFGEATLGLLDHPRVRLVLDDASHHLAAERGAFDVIVGDLVVPWRRGEAALLTREHFERARAALRPGGLFCAWLPLYQLRPRELECVLATFADVFPGATLWRGDWVAGVPTLGLLGSLEGAPLDVAGIDERVLARASAVRQDSPYLVHPAGLWLHLVGALEPLVQAAPEVPRNTLDRPVLELGQLREGAARLDGQALTPYLDRALLAGRSGPLAGLESRHEAWWREGRALFQASVLSDRGAEEEARTLAFEVLGRLPHVIQESLFPGS